LFPFVIFPDLALGERERERERERESSLSYPPEEEALMNLCNKPEI
jgi:hypothetical protein